MHWVSAEPSKDPMEVSIRIRYKHKPARGRLIPQEDGRVTVAFNEAQRALTPGQLAVFYDRDVVLGSAWIDSIID